MSSPTPTIQPYDGAAHLDLPSVAAALSSRFDVHPGVRRSVRRVHLDTFDRRLARAGLTLVQCTAGSPAPTGSTAQLVLTRTRGSAVGPPSAVAEVPDTGLRWPALVGALPPGPLRDQLQPVIGIRALMAVADQRRQVRRIELRNADAKTVVRLELDEPAASSATAASATASPASVTVLPLRGYPEPARRAARILTDLGADLGQGRTHGAERPAGVLVGPGAPAPFDGTAPGRTLLARELAEFATAMRETLPGLVDDVDTEFLHDFRVAVRRTRSTLKLGRDALPAEFPSRWEPEFRWLGDLTTPVRDLDVYQLDLPAMAGWLVAAEPSALEPLAAHLDRRRTTARRTLLRGVRSPRFERLMTQWQQALTDLDQQPSEPRPDSVADERPPVSARRLAHRDIAGAFRRVARDGRAITPQSPGEALHDLRKRCKELRYALEVFAPVTDPALSRRAVKDLKSVQDVLGRFQDAEVQRHALGECAAAMMAGGTPAEAVLAMGELTARLETAQRRARAEFDPAFARLIRPASAERMRRLGGNR